VCVVSSWTLSVVEPAFKRAIPAWVGPCISVSYLYLYSHAVGLFGVLYGPVQSLVGTHDTTDHQSINIIDHACEVRHPRLSLLPSLPRASHSMMS